MCATADRPEVKMHGWTGLTSMVLIRILEGLFAIGAVGSALVIVLSSIEDARTLSSRQIHSESGHES
jgi:hypothetical protein